MVLDKQIVIKKTPFFLLTAIFFVFLAYSYISIGFYQHDEVAHYLNAKNFWINPFDILGYWERPGFKLLYVLPVLIGVKAVHITSIIISVLTCYFAYLSAKKYDLENNYITIIFCAFQPLFMQLSFRMYSEVLASLLVSLMLLSYLHGRYWTVALTSSFLFAVRQEFAVISLILLMFFLFRKEWLAIFLLATTPVILGVLGWLKTGNQMWLLNIYIPIGQYRETFKPGFFHYWKMFEPFAGTAITSLFIVGFLSGFINFKTRFKQHISKYHAIYIIFISIFLFQCLFTSEFISSPSPGWLRYLIPLTPVIAVFSNIGVNELLSTNRISRKHSISIIVLFIVAAFFFISKKHNYLGFTDHDDYTKVAVISIILVLFFIYYNFNAISKNIVIFVLSSIVVIHAFLTEKPILLNAEDKTLNEIVKWYKENSLDDRTTLINHTLFSRQI